MSKPNHPHLWSRFVPLILLGIGIVSILRVGFSGDLKNTAAVASSTAATDGGSNSPTASIVGSPVDLAAPAETKPHPPVGHEMDVAPAEAIERLKVGNYRYVNETPQSQLRSIGHAKPLALGQHPFAVVVGCADSRVSPEILFDQGIGDLFVIRMAGNIVQEDVIASIEYAVEHLDARLVVLLGHERCGAVAAAMSNQEKPGEERGHLGALLRSIYPSLRSLNNSPTNLRCFDSTCAKGTNGVHTADALFCRFCGSLLKKNEEQKAQLLESLAVRSNVRVQIEMLKNSEPVLKPLISNGRIKLVGACYDLDTGTVEFF